MPRLQLTSTGNITTANVASVQSQTKLWGKLQFKVDYVSALSGTLSAFDLTYVGDGTTGGGKCAVFFTALTTSTFQVSFRPFGLAVINGAGNAYTVLPNNGTDIVCYWFADSGGPFYGACLADPSAGTIFAYCLSTSALGGLQVATGNGQVWVNKAILNGAHALDIDGFAVYSGSAPTGALTGATLPVAMAYDTPSTSDSNILLFATLDDTPVSNQVLDSVSGTELFNLVSGQWTQVNGGTWLNSGPVTSPSVVSVTQVGTISTTGTSSGSTSGGLASFTPTGLGDSGSSISALQSLRGIAIKMRFIVDAFNFGGDNTYGLLQIDDGTNPNTKLTCFIDAANVAGTSWNAGMSIPGVGVFRTSAFSQTQTTNPLPAFGASTAVIGYWWWSATGGNQGVTLFDQFGNVIGTFTDTVARGGLPVITNNGRLRINFSQDSTNQSTLHGLIVDGLAIYNGPLAGNAQWATPSVNDAGIVAFWRFDEQAGTTATDDVGGAVLTLSGFSWLSGGAWLASNVVSIPVAGLASPTAIASPASGPGDTTGFIAYGNVITKQIPNAPATSPTQVAGVSQVNYTLYVPAVSSATAVGAITFQISTGSSLNIPVGGVSSQAQVSPVVVSAFTPVVSPRPSTLQYIVDMATQFSTANPGLAVLSNTSQLIERIRSDQRAIFTKVAAVNRKRFLQAATVMSTSAAQNRTIDLSTLTPPVERVLQLELADGRLVSIVDLLDLNAELAPRAYVFGTLLTEVSNDWSPVTQAVTGTVLYVQQPVDLNPAGDLTQTISLPPDWADLLIIPLAQFLAAQDTAPLTGGGTPRSDEIQVLQQLYDSRLQAFLAYCSHYSGVISSRFDIPRPLSSPR